jgi:hypothetical protein
VFGLVIVTEMDMPKSAVGWDSVSRMSWLSGISRLGLRWIIFAGIAAV